MEEKKNQVAPMENVHLLNRYRTELGWTIEKVAKVLGVSRSKAEKNILKFGKLSVGELETLARAWNIPITQFFSQDLLPQGVVQGDISNIKNQFSNEHGDNNFLNEDKGKYKSQNVDNLLVERDRTIKILQEQVEKQRVDIEFLQSVIKDSKK